MSTIKSHFCLMTGRRVDTLAIHRLLLVTGERTYNATKVGPHLVYRRQLSELVDGDNILEIPLQTTFVYYDALNALKAKLKEGLLASLWAQIQLARELVWVPVDVRFQKLHSEREQ